jgi:hypothetical protein
MLRAHKEWAVHGSRASCRQAAAERRNKRVQRVVSCRVVSLRLYCVGLSDTDSGKETAQWSTRLAGWLVTVSW